MSLRLTINAQRDLEDACSYYAERSTAAGASFAETLESVFEHLRAHPESGRLVFGDNAVRRWALTRFPYIIFYRASGDLLEILSIFNTNLDPTKRPE